MSDNKDVMKAVKEMEKILVKYDLTGFIGASNGKRTVSHHHFSDWSCIQEVDGRNQLRVEVNPDDSEEVRAEKFLKLNMTHAAFNGLSPASQNIILMGNLVASAMDSFGMEPGGVIDRSKH